VFAGELTKINTSFKVGYPTWPILGVAALLILNLTREEMACWRPFKKDKKGWWVPGALEAALLTTWVLLAIVYPLSATMTRTDSLARYHDAAGGQTLDGWAFVEARESGEKADYALMRKLVEDERFAGQRLRTLEATDGTYSYASRFATNLGWTALLGWKQHGSSWRGGDSYQRIESRDETVTSIYAAASPEEARDLIDAMGIEAVFWGDLERDQYGMESERTIRLALPHWEQISDETGLSSVWLRPSE
jgi:uncharacterized membrane protein